MANSAGGQPSLFVYGTISLVRSNGSVRRTTSLTSNQFTFGRLSTSDCRLLFETVSKLHARIIVDPLPPYTAVLEVHGVNGVIHNGIPYEKGCHIPLSPPDLITICDRQFLWGSATSLAISIDTPPASQRKQPRQSLINAAARSITPCKPSPSPLPLPAAAAVVEKSQSPAGLFAGLLSPFKSAPSSPSVNAEERFGDQEQDQQDGQEEEQEQDLMSWDEQPHPHLDGEKGDLITWDEVEVELVPTAVDEEEEEVAAAPDEEEGLAIALEEKEKEATPQKARGRFTMQVTPTLSQRPRTLRAPSTLQPARQHSGDQGQGQGRRTSMRMTIVPSSRAGEWIKERDERRRREERVLEEIRVASPELVKALNISPSRSPTKHSPAVTPSRSSTSHPSSSSHTPSHASASSSTSRRISALLLSPAVSSSASGSPARSEQLDEMDEEEEEDSSDEEESEDEVELEEKDEQEEDADAESQSEAEKEEVGEVMVAAMVPLPESPYNAPTATPFGHRSGTALPATPSPSTPSPQQQQQQQQQQAQELQSLPRYNTSRRHSLREKVLIRSAIKKATTPPLTPTFTPTKQQQEVVVVHEPELGEGEVEMRDDFADAEDQESEEGEVLEAHVMERRVKPEEVPLPDSPAGSVAATPSRTPAISPRHTPRDSMDLISANFKPKSPSSSAEAMQGAETEVESDGSEVESESESEEEEGGTASEEELEHQEEMVRGSPSPAIRFAPTFTPTPTRASAPSTPALQRAQRVALPETPADAAYSYTPKPAPRTPVGAHTSAFRTAPSKTPRSIPLPETPVGDQPYVVQAATPQTPASQRQQMSTPVREAFRSEMTSPVNQHRVLPTPRSALRSAVKPSSAGRRKSGRGFLQPPPSTIKRKSVVWDEKLYIQEIVDIRDKSMHWDAAVDGVEEERQQMSPVASGSQVRVQTPQSTIARANATPSTSIRKAQRNPNLTPSLTASLLKSVSPFALPPIKFGPSTPARSHSSPRKAGRVATPAGAVTGGLELPPMATPGSVRRRAGRVATPAPPAPATPKVEQQKQTSVSESVVANRQADIQQLLATPTAASSSTEEPKSVMPKSTSNLIARLEALRRRSLPAVQLNYVERKSETPQAPAQEQVVVEEEVTPGEEHVVEEDQPTEVVEKEEITSHTPIRAQVQPQALSAPTPNLTSGLRRLFGQQSAAPQATPKFSGIRSLFTIPASPVNSPKLDGLADMLQSPVAPSAPATPVAVQSTAREEEDKVQQSAVIEQEEVEQSTVDDDEPSIGLNSVDLGSHGVGIEADILLASALKPSYIDEVSPPVSPSVSRGATPMASPSPSPIKQVEQTQVEEKAEQEQDPIAEEPIVEQAVEQEVTVNESPVEQAQAEEDQPEEIVEVATPAPRRGRPTKAAAAAKKSSSKKAAKVVEQSQEESAESEPAPVSAAKSTRGSTRSTRTAKASEEDEEVHATPAPPARRSRAKKVDEPMVVEEQPAEDETAEAEAAPVVVSKPTRGRVAKAKVVEEKREEEPVPAPKPVRRSRAAKVEPVVEVIVAPVRGRRTVAKKVEPEAESAPEHETEQAEEDVEAPAPVKKAAPPRKGRAVKPAPVAVLEDEDVDTLAPAPAPTRVARGKRAILEPSSSEEAAPAPVVKPTRTSRAKVIAEVVIETENAAPAAATRTKRAPAVKKVVEEAAPSTGRALRARR